MFDGLFRGRRRKVFVIGRNKTGTTSIAEALSRAGYRVGDQGQAERLMDDWMRRDFRRLIRYCRTAEAFQDVPFSLAYTWQAVDAAFPGSRFILTVRDSAEQWYASLTRYHSKLLGLSHCPPTADDLKSAAYVRPGWLWRQQEIVYGATEATAYDPDLYMQHYRRHNRAVQQYFRHRPDDLLVLNLADVDSGDNLCRFLGMKPGSVTVPHLNQSGA